MKVRKKPITVDAHQFIASEPLWPAGVFESRVVPGTYKIQTEEGEMSVEDRSYIITGAKGERWAIAEKIFDETYEAVLSDAGVAASASWR